MESILNGPMVGLDLRGGKRLAPPSIGCRMSVERAFLFILLAAVEENGRLFAIYE